MKISILLFLLVISFTVAAQKESYLVVRNDTSFYQISVKKKKSEDKIYIKNSTSAHWNIIYPENAELACIADKKMYVSVKHPRENRKVWMRCYFAGEDQLLLFKGNYYIRRNNELYKLKKKSDSEAERGVKLYIGQMIALYTKKVDFDFIRMQYDPSSLSKPIRKYHEENGIKFQDFSDYVAVKTTTEISVGASANQVQLRISDIEKRDVTADGLFAEGGFNLSSRSLKRFLSFYIGARLSYQRIDNQVALIAGTAYDSYYTVNGNAVSLAFPLLLDLKLVNSPSINLSYRGGAEFAAIKWFNHSVRSEIDLGGVVNTSFLDKDTGFPLFVSQANQVLLKLPKISSRFTVGGEYKYQLINMRSYFYLELNRSTSFFIRYSF